jgi:nitroreductase
MNPPSTPAQLLECLRWRYATKQFDATRPIDPDVWAALEEALVLAPSSFGLQPWKFLVVESPAVRQELRAASWNQSQITDSSKLVVFLGLRTMAIEDIDRYLQRTSEVRGMPVSTFDGYRKVLVNFVQTGWASKDLHGWNTRQVYIALGQFMTSAAMLGIDTCPMEGIDMAAYDRILGLESTPFTTVCACTAGHRNAGDKYALTPKVRYAKEHVVERR